MYQKESQINLIHKIEEVVQDVVKSSEKMVEEEIIGVITKTISSILQSQYHRTENKDYDKEG